MNIEDINSNYNLENIEGEIWKDIPEYEGYYQASNLGRVKGVRRKYWSSANKSFSTIKAKIKQSRLNDRGYFETLLHKDGKAKNIRVHQLVNRAFNKNIHNKPFTNHINEIKTDNRSCNLEWVTHIENCNHGTAIERRTAKKRKPVYQYTMEGKFVRRWKSISETEKGGFNFKLVSATCNNVQRHHYNYKWSFNKLH